MQTAKALTQALLVLAPSHMSLDNESHNHAGYFDGKESHFKLVIVSDVFANKRLVARHQLIYQHLASFLVAQGGTVHALAIHAYTPDEWANQQKAPDSPNCAGQHKGSS